MILIPLAALQISLSRVGPDRKGGHGQDEGPCPRLAGDGTCRLVGLRSEGPAYDPEYLSLEESLL